jgi:hypothetical protein
VFDAVVQAGCELVERCQHLLALVVVDVAERGGPGARPRLSRLLPRARRNHPHLADGEGQPPRAAVQERLAAVREEWLDYSLVV